ncbi:MAG: formylglycine-generating enzyme family protein, partial [Victivallales bacterium]|nr:formylglycine-generating enzyme family protein [Victivallales bacterium]
ILVLADELEALDAVLAREWRGKANASLVPSLELKATVNGREVNANVEGQPHRTQLIWENLKRREAFSQRLIYGDGNHTYTGEVILNEVDWYGRKSITVPLKKQEFNGMVTLPGGVKLELIKVEKGEFTMGSPTTEEGRGYNETQHRVHITRHFWLGKYEVTQEQYQAVMGRNPSHFRKGDRYPVEGVNWDDAMEFCRKLNELERQAGRLPYGYEYTLPTEAQWEYAARGGNKSNGYKYSGSNNLDAVGWYFVQRMVSFTRQCRETHPVGEKTFNELGFYDMSGNVEEWCRDSCEWKSGVVTDTYRDEVSDPLCTSGAWRVHRGGGLFTPNSVCRVAARWGRTPLSGTLIGFRVALAPSK